MRVLSLLVLTLAAGSAAACDLQVDAAWIRAAPGNAMSLAGYAVLINGGNKPLTIVSVHSPAFGQIQAHESLTQNGMAIMRAIDKLQIPAQGRVEFAPNGKHFMMMQPKPGLHTGDAVSVTLKDAAGCATTTFFKISRDAASIDGVDHVLIDHANMDHSKMTGSKMNGAATSAMPK